MKEHKTKSRRRYREGCWCEDCGTSRATVITFWASGMRYRVCSQCIKPYRGIITKPCACEGN